MVDHQKSTPVPSSHSRCEDDLMRTGRQLDGCSQRVEHLEALLEFYQSDNEQLRSILRMKDALRRPADVTADGSESP